jgi:hypothetical protein
MNWTGESCLRAGLSHRFPIFFAVGLFHSNQDFAEFGGVFSIAEDAASGLPLSTASTTGQSKRIYVYSSWTQEYASRNTFQ